MMTSDTRVLITGVTGLLGFRTLRYALDSGLRVRAAVRSDAKAELVRSNPVLKFKEGQLDFIVIPDMTVSGAFDAAVQGISHIIHIASPVSTEAEDNETDLDALLVKPAVEMVLGLFKSAEKAGRVERIVVTSSAAAIVPASAFFQNTGVVHKAETRQPEMPPPYDRTLVAYIASKIAALNRAEKWIEDNKPSFDVIHFFPSFILGRDDTATTTDTFQRTTNRYIINGALGKPNPQVPARPQTFNSVHDCAMVHVKALNVSVPGNQGYIVSNAGGDDGFEWRSAIEIIASNFPDAVKQNIFSNDAYTSTIPCALDVKKTEVAFGFTHSAYEPLVIEVIGHYLEVLATEKRGLGESCGLS